MSQWQRLARERWWIWGLPLLLVLVGVGFLGNYLLALSGEGKSLLRDLDATEQELTDLKRQRAEIEARLEAVRTNEKAIDELYEERLATESRRLTAILSEVKELADQAGLHAEAINYGDAELEEYGLRRKTFSFNVEGSFEQLRRLVHLLEQSESFLTLERIGLSEAAGSNRLRINLGLSTLFADEASR